MQHVSVSDDEYYRFSRETNQQLGYLNDDQFYFYPRAVSRWGFPFGRPDSAALLGGTTYFIADDRVYVYYESATVSFFLSLCLVDFDRFITPFI